jgi:Transposase DDE domain.
MKRDWKEYNKQLVKRGEIIIYEDIFLSENTLPSKIQKAGRPKTYSDSLILFALTLKFMLSIPYRQLEGLITSLFKSLDAKVKIPNFRTIHYRFSKLESKIKEVFKTSGINFDNIPDECVVIIDSTGVRLSNKGEWMAKRHKIKRNKKWLKIHVAVDSTSKQVIDIQITQENVHDIKKAKELVENAFRNLEEKGKRIHKVLADKGYDARDFYDFIKRIGAIAGIIPRKNSKTKFNGYRDLVVNRIKEIGINAYKQEIGYSLRNIVEGFFSIFKRRFGEHVVSKKLENIKTEIFLKAMLINRFLTMNNY